MGSTAEKGEKRFTYSEYCKWDDEQRWELIGGVPYNMTPAPPTKHQLLLGNLSREVMLFLNGKRCQAFVAPTDVVFDEYNVVQPDFLVVCDTSKITEANIQGAPDLVVEILSPSTSRKDRREKKVLYERFGVREYIVIDPANETVERFRLVRGKYGNPDVFGWDASMKLAVFPERELNLWEIFEKEKVEAVNERKIDGAWIGNNGLAYIITQVRDKFVWKMINRQGAEQTGIGEFLNEETIQVVWDLDHGVCGKTRSATGKIIADQIEKDKAVQINWSDQDVFVRSLSPE